MAKNTNMTLGTHFDEFIANQLNSERYGSASEVICAGLRLLEHSEIKREALIQLLIGGEESGLVNYSYDEFMIELDDQR